MGLFSWVSNAWDGIVDFVSESASDLGSAISESWKDAGKILDKYVVKPIEKDPWGFIVTAAAASFGIPYIVGPGMIASGIASTAVSLAQGKDFDDALTDGVTAAVLDFGISEGFNVLKGSPKPFGSSANIGAQFDSTPTFESMFGDAAPTKTVTNQLDDSLNLNKDFTSAMPENQVGALDLNKELDFNPQQFDEMAALRPDEIAAMNEGSYFNDPYPNETYLNDDGMLGFDRGQYAAYTEPAPRLSDIYPEPKNYLSDISTNELGALPDSGTYKAPIVDMGVDATKKAADITAGDWWKHPVDTLGKYTEDKIGVDITNPWIVGGAGLGLSYLQKKKAAEEERRRREEAARNDPLNSPLFTSRLQQYKYERNRNKYTGDPIRYGQRDNVNQGEFAFYDPAQFTPITPAATGGQIRAPHSYYQYGNVPASVKEYAHGGLNALSHGRSDDIPAVLSDGEYVMDAETVALLGNGSTDAGAKQLDRMRESLRKQKGKALSKGKFSPNAKSPLAYLQRG